MFFVSDPVPIQTVDKNDSRPRGLTGGENRTHVSGTLQSGIIIVGEIRKASIYLIVTFLGSGHGRNSCRAVVPERELCGCSNMSRRRNLLWLSWDFEAWFEFKVVSDARRA